MFWWTAALTLIVLLTSCPSEETVAAQPPAASTTPAGVAPGAGGGLEPGSPVPSSNEIRDEDAAESTPLQAEPEPELVAPVRLPRKPRPPHRAAQPTAHKSAATARLRRELSELDEHLNDLKVTHKALGARMAGPGANPELQQALRALAIDIDELTVRQKQLEDELVRLQR